MDSLVKVITSAFRQLDLLLKRAVSLAKNSYESQEPSRFKGLAVSAEEAADLLSREPGLPSLRHGEAGAGFLSDPVAQFHPFAGLVKSFNLTPFDLDVAIVALAPEFDLRYERLYAFLQDDATRHRPTVDLVLNLLCASAEEKVARRVNFATDAPLVRHGLLHLVPDPNHVQPPLLAHYLKLDDQIVSFLLGEQGLDRRLDGFCQWFQPEQEPTASLGQCPLPAETGLGLQNLVVQARSSSRPLRLYFQGRCGSGRFRTARALANESTLGLVLARLDRLLQHDKSEFELAVKTLVREALLKQAVLYLEGADLLRRDEWMPQFRNLLQSLERFPGITILAGEEPWIPSGWGLPGVLNVAFSNTDFLLCRKHWQAGLAAHRVVLAEEELDALAGRFRLTPGQIDDAVSHARNRAIWRAVSPEARLGMEPKKLQPAPTLDDLFASSRAQCGHELAKLARRIEAKQTWNDIVLPADQLTQLREICEQFKFRHHVYGEWGFGRKLSLGKGLNVLFAGPPGTGKTMAAEVIARELQLDAYKIDLSQVVSKYIGETEKNLNRIFVAAETANAILFFDEADALFGKRSEVKDAHDRYANIEIGYLLQKMEEYEGVAILATNLRQNLDEAFLRRMQIIVEFPFPDEDYRRRIWTVVFPREAPVGDDVDFRRLAREVKLAGGNIKNIALAAAFYAAADGRVIRMPHLVRAASREHQKLGRSWSEAGSGAPAQRSADGG